LTEEEKLNWKNKRDSNYMRDFESKYDWIQNGDYEVKEKVQVKEK